MNKVCAVFGGSRGIGRAVAQLMAQKGYRLAIISRNVEVAKATAGALGGGHLAFRCDVAKERDVQNTFEEIEKNLGPVNFLVNTAGINRDSLLVRTKSEDMLSQLHTNLLGSMLTCKAAVKTMIQQQGGAIVNVVVAELVLVSVRPSASVGPGHVLTGLTWSPCQVVHCPGGRGKSDARLFCLHKAHCSFY
ncbi:3-oxoacyl-[acyl-carrier-protein] reductase isoform X5 [Artibeus jamaicensis]|uniref:3-oxoacyl-[acyl-carrier-protein] reductase isoform X5 n=1 Tax=Artibeus jamaicensis TaxID=9417 RepID=UPI00235A6753|nr:3-oxoacyl-[acyl-carrier-protein] reductase isoform X5 [Artibeus jamaicensis]